MSMPRPLVSLFPACAGVILDKSLNWCKTTAFPRVCGGDPYLRSTMKKNVVFSPRVRG